MAPKDQEKTAFGFLLIYSNGKKHKRCTRNIPKVNGKSFGWSNTQRMSCVPWWHDCVWDYTKRSSVTYRFTSLTKAHYPAWWGPFLITPPLKKRATLYCNMRRNQVSDNKQLRISGKLANGCATGWWIKLCLTLSRTRKSILSGPTPYILKKKYFFLSPGDKVHVTFHPICIAAVEAEVVWLTACPLHPLLINHAAL